MKPQRREVVLGNDPCQGLERAGFYALAGWEWPSDRGHGPRPPGILRFLQMVWYRSGMTPRQENEQVRRSRTTSQNRDGFTPFSFYAERRCAYDIRRTYSEKNGHSVWMTVRASNRTSTEALLCHPCAEPARSEAEWAGVPKSRGVLDSRLRGNDSTATVRQLGGFFNDRRGTHPYQPGEVGTASPTSAGRVLLRGSQDRNARGGNCARQSQFRLGREKGCQLLRMQRAIAILSPEATICMLSADDCLVRMKGM
jgi:hypothetical protein